MSVRPPFLSRLLARPALLLVGAALLYLLLYLVLSPWLGSVVTVLAILPVLLAGWLYGRRTGVLLALVYIAFSLLYRAVFEQAQLADLPGYLPTYITLLVAAFTTGWLHDLNLRLSRELAHRHRVEAALEASRGRFQALTEHSADGISLIGPDGVVLYASPAAERLLGAPADYWIGGTFFTRLHPDDAPVVERLWAELLAQPTVSVQAEFRYRHFDGSWRWLAATGANRLADPAVGAVVINYRDETDRRQANATLQQAERQYRTLVEQIPAILYKADLDESGTALYNSPQIARLGHTPAEYAADPELWLRSIHPADRDRVQAELARMEAEGGGSNVEYRVLHPDGRVLWVQDEAVIVRDEAGRPLYQQGVVVDITARKEAEAALAAREQRFRALIEHAGDLIGLVSAQGRILYASPAVRPVLGYDPAELVGLDLAARTHPDDFPGLEAQIAALLDQPGQTASVQYRYQHQDGSWRWIESTITNLLAEPSVAALVFNARDITERRQHERELEAVVSVGTALRAANTRAQMLPAVLHQVLAVLELDGAALALRDETTGDVVIELSVGQWAADTGYRLRPGEGVTGLVMQTGRPYVSAAVAADPQFLNRDRLAELHAVACVPLIVRQDIIGTLWAARDAEITAGEVRLLTAIAEIAASAIQRITLLEITAQGLERLTALRTIERAISNSLDLRLTLHILLEQITSLLRVDAAAVLLLEPDTQLLSLAASHGLGAAGRARPELRLGQGRAGRVALDRRRLEVLDLAADPAERPAPPGDDFRAYIGLPLLSKGEVLGVLEIYQRAPLAPTRDWRVFLEALAGQAALAIDNAQLFTRLQDSNLQLTVAYDATIEGWSAALDLRDHETDGHSRRVADLTLALAQAVGVPDAELTHLRRGALLHDLGQLSLPDHLLRKPGPLTPEERELVRRHPRAAYDLLARIHYLRPALDIPYCHHEKWDGTGYPRGLKGLQIPLAARLFAVADVWDALCSARPYRPAWPLERVRAYLREQSGRHFDPAVVETFTQLEASGQIAALAAAPFA